MPWGENDGGDEDDDKKSKSTIGTKGSASGKKKPSAPEVATTWIEKLSLRGLVEGKKLGVILRHAEAAQSRMSVKEKLLLGTHLKLCRCAQALAPEQLQVQTKDQILEAADALAGHVTTWPEALQRAMWERNVSELVQGVVSHLTSDRLSQLWARMRPYECDDKNAKLSLRDPFLGRMSMKEEERNAMFMDVLLTRLVLPLLLGGESKMSVVQALFASVLKQISHDLELEMPDRDARSLMHVHAALKGVLAIVELKPTAILDFVDEIELLRDVHAKTEEGIAAVVHVIHEVSCYPEKVDAAVKMMKRRSGRLCLSLCRPAGAPPSKTLRRCRRCSQRW